MFHRIDCCSPGNVVMLSFGIHSSPLKLRIFLYVLLIGVESETSFSFSARLAALLFLTPAIFPGDAWMYMDNLG